MNLKRKKLELKKAASNLWHLPVIQFFVNDELYLKSQFKHFIGKSLNLDNPLTFNEKMQWLKLYDRKPECTKMVDKYEVRKYIADTIGAGYLIPLLGVYDQFDEIDFDILPNQFVLKPNHTSGDVYICLDKASIDYVELKKEVDQWLKRQYYWVHREWPYKNVKPRIICEKYLVEESGESLKDFKVMCFNGKAKCFYVCFNRNLEGGVKIVYYDMEWNTKLHERHLPKIPKPENFDKMVELAEKLSEKTIFMRVDFYEVSGQVYFGEITFYPGSGFKAFVPESYDYLLGSWLELPSEDGETVI